MSSKLHIKTRNVGSDVAIVTFLDKRIHDDRQIERIKEGLHSLMDEQGKKKIILDFTGVEYTNEWFGMLVGFRKKILAIGGKLVMCHMCKDVFQTFQQLRINKTFIIVSNEEIALLEISQEEADEPIFLKRE